MKKLLLTIGIIASVFSLTANAHSTNYRHHHKHKNVIVKKAVVKKHYIKHHNKYHNKHYYRHHIVKKAR